ncbi:hypothetical protein MIDIC_110052 [Alphaproteobacteria bacterium]
MQGTDGAQNHSNVLDMHEDLSIRVTQQYIVKVWFRKKSPFIFGGHKYDKINIVVKLGIWYIGIGRKYDAYLCCNWLFFLRS